MRSAGGASSTSSEGGGGCSRQRSGGESAIATRWDGGTGGRSTCGSVGSYWVDGRHGDRAGGHSIAGVGNREAGSSWHGV